MRKYAAILLFVLASCTAVPKDNLTPEQKQRQEQQRKEIINGLIIIAIRVLIRVI